MSTLVVGPAGFQLDGQEFQIISGAMHYFRIHQDQWVDRIDKARVMGLNTIDTYIPWNLHEPARGVFRMDGMLDLPRYLDLIAAAGLRVLLRPGPYICAELDAGGLPSWLRTVPGMRLRSGTPEFLSAVDDYFDQLLPRLTPYLAANGGPVIAVQVENEFGVHGEDPTYLEHLAKGLRSRGVTEPLFTCDQANAEMLARGGVPGVLQTATFGSRVEQSLRTLRQYQPDGPLMCTEFWNGWFDYWGGPRHVRAVADAAADLEAMLAAGASVSLYMFHGGTNAGFINGANLKYNYQPTITSYDYDAPLSECGDLTPKFLAFQDVISRYAPVPAGPVPAPGRKLSVAGIGLDRSVRLLDCVERFGPSVRAEQPLSMEQLGQAFGFVLYRTELAGAGPAVLTFDHIADRAQVFVDGRPQGTLERERGEHSICVVAPRAGARLTVLVENLGRVNYGPDLADEKGLLGAVRCDGVPLVGWDCHPLPLDTLDPLRFGPADPCPVGPTFHRGTVDLADPADTFLRLDNWTKGQAWVNGFNLGRYWCRGPQHTLYVPGVLLRAGANEITLLELHASRGATVDLVADPDLGIVET